MTGMKSLFTRSDFGDTGPDPDCGQERYPCKYDDMASSLKLAPCPHMDVCWYRWRDQPAYRFPKGFDAKENGYIETQPMDGGSRYWCMLPLTLGRLRIVIAEDQFTAGEHWCYSDTEKAWESYRRGPDHNPTGWDRHMASNGQFEYPR